MKLNQLSVIFIIIILPMSLILSTYIGNLVDVSNQLSQYNALILNATYDAVKALEMNDLNDEYNLQTISLERNISGSVNSFFDSFANGMGQTGYTKEDVKDYVPVMLYTMYDGFYLYGPHENVKVQPSESMGEEKIEYGTKTFTPNNGTQVTCYCEFYKVDKDDGNEYFCVTRAFIGGKWVTDKNGVYKSNGEWDGNSAEYNGTVMKYKFQDNKLLDQQYGLKPYTHYTCRYMSDKNNTNAQNAYDLTINYSLDNFISIHGIWKGVSIDESGYLVNTNEDRFTKDGDYFIVKGVRVGPEALREHIISRVAKMTVETKPSGGKVYATYTNAPNGDFDKKVNNAYPYIVYNNTKYYLDTEFNDYVGKFNYVYDATNRINVSFSDTFSGYPIFRLDESKNVNTRVYLNRDEVQTLCDYMNRCPLTNNGGRPLETKDFYVLGDTDYYEDPQANNAKKSIVDHIEANINLFQHDEVNNYYYINYDRNNNRNPNGMVTYFKDVNAWLYYENAYNFTKGGIAYKDKDGDNRINTTYTGATEKEKMQKNPDYWPGVNEILKDIKKKNAVSNIFNQEYKVTSGGTGEVIEVKTEEGTTSEYISSHDLYVNDNEAVLFDFDVNNDANDPEQSDSTFNKHRMDVIIKTVEYNLVNSIANYKKYVTESGISTDFEYQMPTLSPNEWDVISSEISVLTFVQGLPVKRYRYFSDYALVSSTKNNLFASRNSIYVTSGPDKDNNYHDPRCGDLYKKDDNGTASNSQYSELEVDPEHHVDFVGYQNVDFDQTFKSGAYVDDKSKRNDNGETYYYYRQGASADYDCAVLKGDTVLTIDQVTSNSNGWVTSINGNGIKYDLSYNDNNTNNASSNARNAYIRALARRRYSLYSARNPEDSKVRTN